MSDDQVSRTVRMRERDYCHERDDTDSAPGADVPDDSNYCSARWTCDGCRRHFDCTLRYDHTGPHVAHGLRDRVLSVRQRVRPEGRLTDEQLQSVSDIIRSVSLSRGDVDTSSPEQVVWMTARVIESDLIAFANGEDHNYRWLPQVYGIVADIRREIEGMKLADSVKARVLTRIDRAANGWPS